MHSVVVVHDDEDVGHALGRADGLGHVGALRWSDRFGQLRPSGKLGSCCGCWLWGCGHRASDVHHIHSAVCFPAAAARLLYPDAARELTRFSDHEAVRFGHLNQGVTSR